MSLASTVQRITTSRPVEVYQYYGSMNGSLLASGIAYNVVFSIFPLLVNSPGKRLVMLGEGTHTMLMERNRGALFQTVQGFLEEAPAA